MKRILIAWLCGWQVGSPVAWGAAIPTERLRLGLLRVGQMDSPTTERSLSILESRLRRWLENLPSWEGEVHPLARSVHAEDLGWETEAARLRTLSEALSIATPADASGLLDRVAEARERLGRLPRLLPAVQGALSAEAFYWWRQGEKKRTSALLKEAVGLHPDGVIQGRSDWETETSDLPKGFGGEVLRASSALRRECAVEVETIPEQASLAVNGFSMGNRREFHLPLGRRFTITASVPGHDSAKREIDCRRQKRETVVLRLPASVSPFSSRYDLAGISRGNGMQSLCLIEATSDQFRLYLYSPGLPIDEIPLAAPLRIADVAALGGESELPVRTDAFLSLYEKHRLAAADLFTITRSDAGVGEVSGLATSPRWYNDWRVWAIAGAVVAGATSLYFLTREGSVQSTPKSGGLRLQWE